MAADTVNFYKAKAGHLARVLGLTTPMNTIGAKAVKHYVTTRRGEDAGDHTLAKELTALRIALRLAKVEGIWDGHLDETFPVGLAAHYTPRRRWLTPAEVMRLVAELPADRSAQVAYLVATSAEWGAMGRAERGDAPLDEGFVHVRGTKRETRDREVPVVLPIAKALIEHALKHGGGKEPLLFRSWGNVNRAPRTRAGQSVQGHRVPERSEACHTVQPARLHPGGARPVYAQRPKAHLRGLVPGPRHRPELHTPGRWDTPTRPWSTGCTASSTRPSFSR